MTVCGAGGGWQELDRLELIRGDDLATVEILHQLEVGLAGREGISPLKVVVSHMLEHGIPGATRLNLGEVRRAPLAASSRGKWTASEVAQNMRFPLVHAIRLVVTIENMEETVIDCLRRWSFWSDEVARAIVLQDISHFDPRRHLGSYRTGGRRA